MVIKPHISGTGLPIKHDTGMWATLNKGGRKENLGEYCCRNKNSKIVHVHSMPRKSTEEIKVQLYSFLTSASDKTFSGHIWGK
jgi:hypothetical protein